MTPQAIIQTGHNLYERIDDRTIKQLCVSCGGNGFFLMVNGFPNSKDSHRTGEIKPCNCEDGFKYKNYLVEDHGG